MSFANNNRSLTALVVELLLEIVRYTEDDGATWEFPSVSTVSLSQTCKTLYEVARPFLERRRSGNKVLDIGRRSMPNLTGLTCHDSNNEMVKEPSDEYFNSIRWLRLEVGALDGIWEALSPEGFRVQKGEEALYYNLPFTPCDPDDNIAKRLVSHLQSPRPFNSIVGLYLTIVLPGPTRPHSIDTISRLLRGSKLKFLHIHDPHSEGPVHLPQIPGHLLTSLSTGSAQSERIDTLTQLVAGPLSLENNLFCPEMSLRWPSLWQKSLRRIQVRRFHLNGSKALYNDLKVSRDNTQVQALAKSAFPLHE